MCADLASPSKPQSCRQSLAQTDADKIENKATMSWCCCLYCMQWRQPGQASLLRLSGELCGNMQLQVTAVHILGTLCSRSHTARLLLVTVTMARTACVGRNHSDHGCTELNVTNTGQ
eukprot:jgi/Ulvmu1/10768/UM069_0002.1